MQIPPAGQCNGTVSRLKSPVQEGDTQSTADLHWWQGVVQYLPVIRLWVGPWSIPRHSRNNIDRAIELKPKKKKKVCRDITYCISRAGTASWSFWKAGWVTFNFSAQFTKVSERRGERKGDLVQPKDNSSFQSKNTYKKTTQSNPFCIRLKHVSFNFKLSMSFDFFNLANFDMSCCF